MIAAATIDPVLLEGLRKKIEIFGRAKALTFKPEDLMKVLYAVSWVYMLMALPLMAIYTLYMFGGPVLPLVQISNRVVAPLGELFRIAALFGRLSIEYQSILIFLVVWWIIVRKTTGIFFPFLNGYATLDMWKKVLMVVSLPAFAAVIAVFLLTLPVLFAVVAQIAVWTFALWLVVNGSLIATTYLARVVAKQARWRMILIFMGGLLAGAPVFSNAILKP